MQSVECLSPAKVNLTLRVLGRRADGYHEIESLVARVTLADEVGVAVGEAAGAASSGGHPWRITCSDPAVPTDERNLAWQAAARLAEAAALAPQPLHIHLEKRIPAGMGLGGGSSNAATVLRLLNKIWGLNWPAGRLAEVGARIGSDIPLFLGGPVCILRGRGEQIEPVRARPRGRVVLFLPTLASPTGPVYAAWPAHRPTADRPAISDILACLDDPPTLRAQLFNDLEAAATAVTPALGLLAAHLRARCPVPVCMSGSGAAYFALATDDELPAIRAAVEDSPVPVRTEVADFE